ncbi:AraC family transcriptional regulator [Dysgonomonas sp. Marseille-P4677]|uniref:helix-turn-helix domain-containing protein n=1 Tax=Dysgonomonas sp. Marseille-P4677 TaxID=2364790 RepID=UPI001913F506|nr:helix-turn-helix domain-containing protein [Dysgonomonas sp. Marseille-P4677]MBK5721853.1 AraC family transcriptional regulator [Dysgonomonas sp. Marseille-P4677]
MEYSTDRGPSGRNRNEYVTLDDFNYIMDTGVFPQIRPILNQPSGILVFCLEGSAKVNVYTQEYWFSKNQLIVVLPGQLISVKEKSEDFRISYFLVSLEFIEDILRGIPRLSPLFFIYMRRKHQYMLQRDEVHRISQYFKLVDSWVQPADKLFRREYVVNLLRLLYLDLYNNYISNLLAIEVSSYRRKEQLTYDFFLLVMMHFKEYREIAFYADKLRISPKYLTSVIKGVSYRSPKDWIVDYTIMEIKALLKNAALNIQEITVMMNFSSQASMSRFFKKHTGKSPTEYRLGK